MVACTPKCETFIPMSFTLHLESDGSIGRPELLRPNEDTHKYRRGHAIVISGPALRTGASRLAAQAALAVGAGLVTIIGEPTALHEHSAHVTAIMLREKDPEFSVVDDRVRAIVVGPGAGVSHALANDVLALLSKQIPTVLDADALSSFEANPELLFGSLHNQAVLTPHEGEFARLFPDISLKDKVADAREAAHRAGCTILLKGPETVIASPDGRLAINRHASPWLATAGSGDVLAGVVGGLLAQGMNTFEAVAIGAWLHGDIGIQFGPGLTADAMPGQIPDVLHRCMARSVDKIEQTGLERDTGK